MNKSVIRTLSAYPEDGFSNEKINMSENVPEFSLDKGIPSSRDYLMEESKDFLLRFFIHRIFRILCLFNISTYADNSTCSAYGTRNIE